MNIKITNSQYNRLNEEISDKTVDAVVRKLLKTYHYKDNNLRFKDTDTALDPVDALDLVEKIKDLIGNNKNDFKKVVDKFHKVYHKEANQNKLTEQISDKSIENFTNHMVDKWDYMGYKSSDTNFYFKDKNGTLWDSYFIRKYIEDRMTEKRSEITDIYKRFAYKIIEKYGLKSLFDKEFNGNIHEEVSDKKIKLIKKLVNDRFYSKRIVGGIGLWEKPYDDKPPRPVTLEKIEHYIFGLIGYVPPYTHQIIKDALYEEVSDNTIDKIADKIIKKFYSPSSKLEGTERLVAIGDYVENMYGNDYHDQMDKIYQNLVQKIKPY